jgi:hypothetical protein
MRASIATSRAGPSNQHMALGHVYGEVGLDMRMVRVYALDIMSQDEA